MRSAIDLGLLVRSRGALALTRVMMPMAKTTPMRRTVDRNIAKKRILELRDEIGSISYRREVSVRLREIVPDGST